MPHQSGWFCSAGAGIDAKCIQSSGRSKMVDLYDTLNQGTSQEIMTCNNLPKNLVSEYFSNDSTTAD